MQKLLFYCRNASFVLMLFCMVACQRSIQEPNPTTGTNNTTPIDDNVQVRAGVRGIVVDESNQPIIGATVKCGTNTTTTDRYGVFSFLNINLSKENGHVQIEKQGFFTGHRTFPSTAGRTHNVRIKLIGKTYTGNFTATTGGTITLASGGKLVMPANAITDASGNAYTGQVNIAMTWIDPTATDLFDRVMGDLRGITTAGEERGLQTFGMLGVEMTSPSGQQLKIAAGKKAALTFPIPAALQSSAPTTIDLWHFDEVKGRWVQEGTATKSGANYEAEVSHFSFWNCDAPFPLINLCMNIMNGNSNNPLSNAHIRIKRANGNAASGYTDSAGNLCGKVPKNEALVLEVLDQCYSPVFTQNIGPFTADASLGTINATIPTANLLTITGTLQNCAATNVTNGVLILYMAGGYSYNIPVTNGTFSQPILRCNASPVNFSALGVDYATLQQSVLVGGSGTSGTVNIGTVQACGTSSAEYIEWLIDGTPYNLASPPDQIVAIDSTDVLPFPNKTIVYANRQSAGNTNFTQFEFRNNQAPGSGLPLTLVNLNLSGLSSNQILTANPVVNTTVFGPIITGFIEGSFNIQMNFSGTTKAVNCNFKVKRG
ncbi:MAG: hypothetical protein RIR12_657 [Bacteroidota bacterium]|jgi:hypothetical protein